MTNKPTNCLLGGALGDSLEETRDKVYKAAEVIDFEGKYFRKDIGLM